MNHNGPAAAHHAVRIRPLTCVDGVSATAGPVWDTATVLLPEAWGTQESVLPLTIRLTA
ncbi:MAG TPA: hypothetical protein VFV34_17545 [Blastocatellia bacterium]|nr:hypothetical protein [Blastocatellia bacterium]